MKFVHSQASDSNRFNLIGRNLCIQLDLLFSEIPINTNSLERVVLVTIKDLLGVILSLLTLKFVNYGTHQLYYCNIFIQSGMFLILT